MSLTLILYLVGVIAWGLVLSAALDKTAPRVMAENPAASPRMVRTIGAIFYAVLALVWPLTAVGVLIAILTKARR